MLRSVLTSRLTSKTAIFAFAAEKEEELLALKQMIEDGAIQSVVDKVYSIDQAAEAHARVETEQRRGSVVIALGDAHAPWSTAAVRVNGANVTLEYSHVRHGGDQVEIVVTDTPAAIAGLVTDARGRPSAHDWVVVFPADAHVVGRPRVVYSARLRQDGRFRIEPVAPGNYLAIAVSIPQNGWSDPRVAEQLWAEATAFRVAPSEQRILHLELSPAPAALEAAR